MSLNTEGEITFLNRHGQRFCGYSNEEILGKPMLGTLTRLAGFSANKPPRAIARDECWANYPHTL